MRYAIFSDVHNHTVALSAMLQDARNAGVNTYLCLGDTGVDACVDLVRTVGATAVFGNWEVSGWRGLSLANQRWVLRLPPMEKYETFWISHAAPTWPAETTSLKRFLDQRHRLSAARVFPYYLSESDSLWQAFAELMAAKIPILFHGHTHRQQGWLLKADNELSQIVPRTFTLMDGDTAIIGVGSVGQPRDLPKSAYVIYDDLTLTVEFRRLPLP